MVASATADTITDPNNTINVNPFGTGLPENYGVAIVSGTGAGQSRDVISYSNYTMQVDHPWDVIPDSTSHYATFVWGLEKALIAAKHPDRQSPWNMALSGGGSGRRYRRQHDHERRRDLYQVFRVSGGHAIRSEL